MQLLHIMATLPKAVGSSLLTYLIPALMKSSLRADHLCTAQKTLWHDSRNGTGEPKALLCCTCIKQSALSLKGSGLIADGQPVECVKNLNRVDDCKIADKEVRS